jgi:hypothetical protein
MMDQKTPSAQPEKLNTQPPRDAYTAPRLKRHGDLEQITQTSTGRMFMALSMGG